MRGFLMFVGALAFTGILGVGLYWLLNNTRFGPIKNRDSDNYTETTDNNKDKE